MESNRGELFEMAWFAVGMFGRRLRNFDALSCWMRGGANDQSPLASRVHSKY